MQVASEPPLPISPEQIMDALLFAIAQHPSGLPDAEEMREALDDATHHQLRDDDLDRLSHIMVQMFQRGITPPKRLPSP